MTSSEEIHKVWKAITSSQSIDVESISDIFTMNRSKWSFGESPKIWRSITTTDMDKFYIDTSWNTHKIRMSSDIHGKCSTPRSSQLWKIKQQSSAVRSERMILWIERISSEVFDRFIFFKEPESERESKVFWDYDIGTLFFFGYIRVFEIQDQRRDIRRKYTIDIATISSIFLLFQLIASHLYFWFCNIVWIYGSFESLYLSRIWYDTLEQYHWKHDHHTCEHDSDQKCRTRFTMTWMRCMSIIDHRGRE